MTRPRSYPGARGYLGGGSAQYAPEPIAQANNRALADSAFRQKFAALQNRATDRMRATPSLALSPAHDWSAFDRSFKAPTDRPGMQGAGTASRLDVNSPAVQKMLDAAAGIKPTSPTNTATAYGTGSVRFDKAGGGLAANGAGKSEIIKDEKGNEIGVGRVSPDGQAFDINAARQNLYAAHPEIFKAGTPENKAFTAYANTHGEQAAHENATQIMQPIMNSRLAGATPSAAQARSEIPATGSTEATISKNATDSALAAMAKEKADAGLFDKDSLGGRALTAMKNTPSFPDAVGGGVANTAKFIGIKPESADVAGKSASNVLKDAATGIGDDLRSGAQYVRNIFSPKAPDFSPQDRIGGTGGVTAPLPSQPAQTSQPAASIASTQPKEDDTPNYARGHMPMNADRSMLSVGPVGNYASGFAPTGGAGGSWGGQTETGNELAGEQAFKSNMTAANQALKNDDAAAGFPDQGITTQSLAGKPQYDVAGYNPSGNPEGDQWGDVPNYAGGFRAAMLREGRAIKRGTGGAPKSAKPMPVQLNGRPAVVNSSEKLVPTPKGTAVLNRLQQRNLPDRKSLMLRH